MIEDTFLAPAATPDVPAPAPVAEPEPDPQPVPEASAPVSPVAVAVAVLPVAEGLVADAKAIEAKHFNPAEYAKVAAAVLGLLVTLVTMGVLSGDAAHYVAVIVSVATALGVYAVPNAKP